MIGRWFTLTSDWLSQVGDDSLKRLAKIHKQGRVPSITWRHPASRALLVRGSSYHSRRSALVIARYLDIYNIYNILHCFSTH